MNSIPLPEPASAARFRDLLARRILILDGATGTMIQRHKLTEADFRGSLFCDHPRDLKGNNDLLCLTRPDIIEDIHFAYFEAGADMVETNSFNATSVAQADYGTVELVRDLNIAAAGIARRAADRARSRWPDREFFVAGAIGPTNRTASLSPDVSRPGFRAITFRELADAYRVQAEGLIAGGVDVLLVETIFDTLNAKAAIFAIEECFEAAGIRLPLMLSATVTDASGRTLSGQTVAAFWHSVRHARPASVGLNCALGPEQMRPHIEELSRIADTHVSCYPNAGLPNAFGGYDETPEQVASVLREFAQAGWLNIAGGCCGTTPDHIQAVSAALRDVSPRRAPALPPALRLSGLEPLTA